MKEDLLYQEKLANRMSGYYINNSSYHVDVSNISGQRPSIEEKTLFQKIQAHQDQSKQASQILEIGCGFCESAASLLSMTGAEYFYGIDAAQPAIEFARQKYPHYNLAVGDATKLNFDDNFFDVVVFNFVLEHMVYPDKVLSEAIRVTRPGGIIAMIVPVCDIPWLLPNSLRHQRKNPSFLIRYTLSRWLELLRLVYQPNYYAFRRVDEPIVLLEKKDYKFQPDDDLVYIAYSFEIIKFLTNSGCELLFRSGRDIKSCITNGRRPVIDYLRWLAFTCVRISSMKFKLSDYTTTTSLIVRKPKVSSEG
jgi:ubiquinone/menaquinone biosynthesis C-methylase UbiE